MALINCPACNNRISSKSDVCSHCQAPIAAKNDEATERALARASWKKRKRQQNYSFLAIFSFTVGVALFWYNRGQQSSIAFILGEWLLVGGFLGYSILRIRTILGKFN